MKILISGGHLTPALAFIEYVQAHHPEVELIFVGRLYSQANGQQKSQEEIEVKKRNVPFVSFNSGRSGRSFFAFFQEISLFVNGLLQAFTIMNHYKPNIYLSFGGYLAPPLAIAAKCLGIKIVTHEQTRSIGKATRFVGSLATKVALSYRLNPLPFRSKKMVITGNPVRSALFTKNPSQPSWFDISSNKPLLYVTGGNQGSQVINMTIAQALPQLTRDWVVIHQCGRATNQMNYLKELKQARAQIGPQAQRRYFIREWVVDSELAWILKNAAVVVSRSGANTVQELHLTAVPSILIPLPFAHSNEQFKNAKSLERIGGAIIIEQAHLTPEKLVKELVTLARKRHAMTQRLKMSQPAQPYQASAKLFKVISQVAGG